MKKINGLISQTLSNVSETQSTAPQLTTGDRDIVNWFFLRLENNYGTKFWAQFSDEKTVLLAKREWANQILRYSRDELHIAIEKAKDQRVDGNPDFDWPDIAKIIGLLKCRISPNGGNSGAYIIYKPEKLIEDKGYVAKRKKAGKSALNAMKGLFK